MSTASALAAAERVRPQSMATTVAALEKLGLVTRAADPSDGRRHIIALTEAGQRRVEGAQSAGREWLTTAFETEFDEAERQMIIAAMALLERLVE